MSLKHTPKADLGWPAPAFDLKGIDGRQHTLETCRGPNGLLVMFISNHCPYVQAIAQRLAGDCRDLQRAGIGVVAIMPNDTDAYPADSFDNMVLFAEQSGFGFPYVIDETQDVARAYGAVCTPDFFGFDVDLKLQYRGRLDAWSVQPPPDDRPRELVDAMLEVAESGHTSQPQVPSMGCSIKWRA